MPRIATASVCKSLVLALLCLSQASIANVVVDNYQSSPGASIELYLTNGEPITTIKDLKMNDTPKICANNGEYSVSSVEHN